MNFDISSLKRKMLIKYPFFGRIVANVSYKQNNNIPTAATDGKNIYYNLEFLQKLSVEEQIFILAHEVCHIAFNHIFRSEGKNPRIWNIATDAQINALLKKDGLKLVNGVVDMDEAIYYSAEELYDKLLKENKEQENMDNNSNGNTDSKKENYDVGHDTHSMWEESIKKAKETNNSQPEIEQTQKEIEKIGEKRAFEKNQEQKRQELENLKKTLTEESVKSGSETNGDIRKVTDIGTSKPLINWRYLLKGAIKYYMDYSFTDATIENGVVVPNIETIPIPETEILLDTSSSISEDLLKNFLRECKNLLYSTKLKVGCFDTKFYGFQEIKNQKDIDNMIFQGGGGTNFNVAVDAFSRRTENKIIFTDGRSIMPERSLNAIWIVFGNEKINPKGGKVIYINYEQLKDLCNCQYDDSVKQRRI